MPVVGPVGTVGGETVSKLATTFFGPFMEIDAGLVVPDKSPDQFPKP